MKIVFVGGHHNSALVVAKLLLKRKHKIFWFGHKFTIAKDKSLSAEYLEVRKNKIPFWEIKTSKFYKTRNILSLIKIIYGLFQSLFLLYKLKPSLIVAFGGYLSVPVVLAGHILKIPSFTHEQTTKAGLANKFIKKFVRKIFITWESSRKYFPSRKTELLGLPVNEYLLQTKPAKIFNNNMLTILVLGGKQGSHKINMLIEKILPQLLQKYNIIHQTGRIEKTKDFARLTKLHKGLGSKLKKRYLIKPYFFQQKIAENLAVSDLIISRAGAHITYELMVIGKPAILIPISWVYNNEQYENAKRLSKLGMVKILNEKKISPKKLQLEISSFINKLPEFAWMAKKSRKQVITNAAHKMVEKIETFQK